MDIDITVKLETLVKLKEFCDKPANIYEGGNTGGEQRIIGIKECLSSKEVGYLQTNSCIFELKIHVSEEYSIHTGSGSGNEDAITYRKLIDEFFDTLGIFPKKPKESKGI